MEEIRIRDIMNSNPVMINKKASVLDAAKEMKSEKVGSIIIVENGKPIGILTESDILRDIVAKEQEPSNVTVEQAMTSPLVTIIPEAEINDAMKLMKANNIRRLPVVNQEKIVGMVTERDIMQFSPVLKNIVDEWADITRKRLEYKRGQSQKIIAGKCEECGMLARNLINIDGRLLCEFCLDRME